MTNADYSEDTCFGKKHITISYGMDFGFPLFLAVRHMVP
ncbi:hypothetical protein KsCSTR_34280 [Candidatus Kuenenia stuttgartiensis]|uniref:Uncharacterized protein n=1 Tax=Kuenenia stuttgartiensis TaxID=174633 RepID=A0A6G7GUB9_KUEST|nr:hypothetical protein KsCSTR_34280 [Candidatus Kuenenia stuttgartiensis]